MVNEKYLDLCGTSADSDDSNFKSSFARSMQVNSRHRENGRASLVKEQLPAGDDNSGTDCAPGAAHTKQQAPVKPLDVPEVVRLRRDMKPKSEDTSRLSWGSSSSSRRASICSNKMSEVPIENIFLQSQIDTLQWQLKETESSREMYKAVMKQVVVFLERAHRSLELLGSRLNTSRVSRTQSEYHVNGTMNEIVDESLTNTTNMSSLNVMETSTRRELSWRRSKKPELAPDEIAPEKLSQEAFRLLRTTQSLLSTHEPDLAHVANKTEEDFEFIAQLAKEFPAADTKAQTSTSLSYSPKLLTPDKDTKLPTLNRKYSLQLNDTLRRNSFIRDVSNRLNRSNESSRSSIAESDCILTSTMMDDNRSTKSMDKLKSNSPPVSSIGSAEDESGFSSLNSFQEVGLPTVDEAKGHILKSMLHTEANNCHKDFFPKLAFDDIKLWQTPSSIVHKRWSSTPVENIAENRTLKVLWV